MSDSDIDDDQIELTAQGAKIMANEKISTGDYESHTVSTSLDVSIEGVDLSDGVPQTLQNQLYALKRTLQIQTQQAAEERRPEREAEKRAYEDGP